MKKILFLLFLTFCANLYAQQSEPDIWLLDLNIFDGKLSVANPKNLTTSNKGYDNQPFFTPDGNYLLFSSMRTGNQTDVFRYDLNANYAVPIAVTPESEFSPMYTPDQRKISCVRVEKDSTQRIWAYAYKGGTPNLLLQNIDSVGYHCWINEDSLLVFVLTKPFSLQVVDLKTQTPKIVAQNVGRCFARIPRKNEISYIYKKNDTTSVMYTMSLHDFTSRELQLCNGVCELGKAEDYVWINSTQFLFAQDARLFLNDNKLGKILIADLSNSGIKKITRLAISYDEKKLAIVAYQ